VQCDSLDSEERRNEVLLSCSVDSVSIILAMSAHLQDLEAPNNGFNNKEFSLERKRGNPFLSKVYLTTLVMVIIMATFSLAAALSQSFRNTLTDNSTLYIVLSSVFFMISSLSLACFPRTSKASLLLALIAACSSGLLVSVLTAFYVDEGIGFVVLQAFSMTATLFAVLSAFALFSGIDIKWMGGILLGMLVGFIFVGMFAAIFGWYNAYFFGFFGIVLFSLFVVYDTQIIRDEFSDDMWLFGGVMLYVDFVNLFIQLLSILGNAQRS